MNFKQAPSRARRIPIEGDTIISTVRTYLKAIHYLEDIPDNLIVSTGFAVLHPKKEILPKFLFYVVSSDYFVETVMKKSVGVSYPAINASDLAIINCTNPPYEEQRNIVFFLNQKTSEIDTLIADKEKIVELLQEYRQALINEVVTKGLDPSVEMKESGIEWIGDMPKHWKTNRLSRIAEIKGRIGWRGYRVSDLRNKKEGVLVIGATQINSRNEIDLSNPTYLSKEKYEESPEIKLYGGELLIVKVGATIGKIALVPYDLKKATINPNVMIIRNMKIHNNYLYYLFNSQFVKISMDNAKMAGAQDAINQSFIKSLIMPIPSEEEQMNVCEYLDEKISFNIRIIDLIKTQIEELNNYRQSLISEAVTGKIDIRNYNLNKN